MTPAQVAEHLQVTTDTVYRLIREGELVASKVGRNYRILSDDVDTFLLTHSNQAVAADWLFKRLDERRKERAALFPDLTSDDVLDQLEAWDEADRLLKRHAEIGRRALKLYPGLTEEQVFAELEAIGEERRHARLTHVHRP
jgi:excisionase family DNA binding protein